MRIGAKVTLFNHNMRLKRKEKKYTQQGLADLVGVSVSVISEIELLRQPCTSIDTIKKAFTDICHYLECDFDDIFPQDYIDAIEIRTLPSGKRSRIYFVRDIDVTEMLPTQDTMSLPSPREIMEQRDTQHLVRKCLDKIPPRESAMLKHRYGIDNERHTLEETAKAFGVTRERVRQIEAQSFARLRHPKMKRVLMSESVE